jgi:integrase
MSSVIQPDPSQYTPKMPLSDAKIRSLKTKAKDYKVSDFDALYLLVKKTGSKSWRYKYRFHGKEKLMVFGDYPFVSLAQARTLRDEAKSKLATGSDPNAVKQEDKRAERAKVEETFAALADQYFAKLLAEQRAPATLTKASWLLGMAKADFGGMPIREITVPRVLETLRKLEAKGTYETAKRLRAKIGAVFRFAVASGVADTDPTYALRDAIIRPKTKSRAAILDPKRLGELMRAIDHFNGQATTRLALKVLAILAPRPGDLRQAQWGEIDFEKAIWVIPAGRIKMRKAHVVPLPPQAIRLLQEVQLLTGHGSFLFPSVISSLKPMSENTLNQAQRRMSFSAEEMTAHGFRSTFATLANESGLWHADAIERALAHVDKDAVRRAYTRGEYWDERVRMAEWWAAFLDDLRTPK